MRSAGLATRGPCITAETSCLTLLEEIAEEPPCWYLLQVGTPLMFLKQVGKFGQMNEKPWGCLGAYLVEIFLKPKPSRRDQLQSGLVKATRWCWSSSRGWLSPLLGAAFGLILYIRVFCSVKKATFEVYVLEWSAFSCSFHAFLSWLVPAARGTSRRTTLQAALVKTYLGSNLGENGFPTFERLKKRFMGGFRGFPFERVLLKHFAIASCPEELTTRCCATAWTDPFSQCPTKSGGRAGLHLSLQEKQRSGVLSISR